MKLNGIASKMEQMGSETAPRLVGLCSVVWVRNLKSRFACIWFRFSRIFWDFFVCCCYRWGKSKQQNST